MPLYKSFGALVTDIEGPVVEDRLFWAGLCRRAGPKVYDFMAQQVTRWKKGEIPYSELYLSVVGMVKGCGIAPYDAEQVALSVPYIERSGEFLHTAWKTFNGRLGAVSAGADALVRRVAADHSIGYHVSNPLLHYLGNGGAPVCLVDDTNKGHHLIGLCSRMGIDPRKTAVIGNSIEDFPKFEAAGISFLFAPDDNTREAARARFGNEVYIIENMKGEGLATIGKFLGL